MNIGKIIEVVDVLAPTLLHTSTWPSNGERWSNKQRGKGEEVKRTNGGLRGRCISCKVDALRRPSMRVSPLFFLLHTAFACRPQRLPSKPFPFVLPPTSFHTVPVCKRSNGHLNPRPRVPPPSPPRRRPRRRRVRSAEPTGSEAWRVRWR